MDGSAYVPRLAIRESEKLDSPQHSALVRITHWIHTLSFFALVISGIAILLAHPRLYWGETGGVGTPSLIDLPLPFVLVGQTGWARSLHFLAAWAFVLVGMLYLVAGVTTRHFREDLLPARTELSWKNLWQVVWDRLRFNPSGEDGSRSYNLLQRLTYLGVIFVLSPLIILTGLAMSPAVTSVFPELVTSFGGQQSARTIHFFAASLLVLFLFVHIAMVCASGFRNRMQGMILGNAVRGRIARAGIAAKKESS